MNETEAEYVIACEKAAVYLPALVRYFLMCDEPKNAAIVQELHDRIVKLSKKVGKELKRSR